jgi:DNA polymerase-3 subunit epsilon
MSTIHAHYDFGASQLWVLDGSVQYTRKTIFGRTRSGAIPVDQLQGVRLQRVLGGGALTLLSQGHRPVSLHVDRGRGAAADGAAALIERRTDGPAGQLFTYPVEGGRYDLSGADYAVVDLETTGLWPDRERIVEVGIARFDGRGQLRDQWHTLVNPGPGVGTKVPHIHRITDRMVADAPQFHEVAGDVMARLQGAVVVAHNASFEDRFLTAELARAGHPMPVLPAVDTLAMARRTIHHTPNHRLGTLTRWAGIPLDDAHTALADAVATGRLLKVMKIGQPMRFAMPLPQLLHAEPSGVAVPRVGDPYAAEEAGLEMARGLRKGQGWIASLLERMPSTGSGDGAQEYLDEVSAAIADGRILGEEAKRLARLAGQLGLSRDGAVQVHRQVLDGLRAVAMEDGVITNAEQKALDRAAVQLDLPGYFAALVPVGAA